MIIDAKDLIVGRMATFVAKSALMGETIDIVNSEEAILTGSKSNVLARYKRFREMGTPAKGPFIQRQPDRFVKRIIKRMLPYKQAKGKEAFKRIKCYIGVPDEFKDKPKDTLENANISKVPSLKYVTVKTVCKFMGGKFE